MKGILMKFVHSDMFYPTAIMITQHNELEFPKFRRFLLGNEVYLFCIQNCIQILKYFFNCSTKLIQRYLNSSLLILQKSIFENRPSLFLSTNST